MVKLTAEEKAAAKQAKLDAKAVEKQQQADAKAAEKQIQADAKAAVKAAEETRKAELKEAYNNGYARGCKSGYSQGMQTSDKAISEARKASDQEIKALKAEHKKAIVGLDTAYRAGVKAAVAVAEGKAWDKACANCIKDVIKGLKPALKAKDLRETHNMVKAYVDHLTEQVRK